jgi:hypothetical protein
MEAKTMTSAASPTTWRNDYPSSSKHPMPETDWHRDLMNILIGILKTYFVSQPLVYVSGNLLLFYVPAN